MADRFSLSGPDGGAFGLSPEQLEQAGISGARDKLEFARAAAQGLGPAVIRSIIGIPHAIVNSATGMFEPPPAEPTDERDYPAWRQATEQWKERQAMNAFSLAGMAGGAAVPFRGAIGAQPIVNQGISSELAAPISMASRSPRIYNPPDKAPRPFEADYPGGVQADASGRLTTDIEGRPLAAKYVVGRQVHGGPDAALPETELSAIAQGSAGASITDVPPRAIGNDAGRLVKTTDRRSGKSEYEILLRRGLSESQVPRVAAHEIAHLIDDLAGTIPQTGLKRELGTIYNDLNNPSRGGGKPFTPAAHGYKGVDVGRELMGEAVRAYFTDPNYIKTVAPRAAAAIRAAVNSHPELSRVIQFNALAGGAALPAFGSLGGSEER